MIGTAELAYARRKLTEWLVSHLSPGLSTSDTPSETIILEQEPKDPVPDCADVQQHTREYKRTVSTTSVGGRKTVRHIQPE